MRIIEYIGPWGNPAIVNADKVRQAWALLNNEPTNPHAADGEFRIVCHVDGEDHSVVLKRAKYKGPEEEKKAKQVIESCFDGLTSFLAVPEICARLDLR